MRAEPSILATVCTIDCKSVVLATDCMIDIEAGHSARPHGAPSPPARPPEVASCSWKTVSGAWCKGGWKRPLCR